MSGGVFAAASTLLYCGWRVRIVYFDSDYKEEYIEKRCRRQIIIYPFSYFECISAAQLCLLM